MAAKETAKQGSLWRLVWEVAIWLWALGVMGYFYYSRDFIPLIRHLWTQALG